MSWYICTGETQIEWRSKRKCSIPIFDRVTRGPPGRIVNHAPVTHSLCAWRQATWTTQFNDFGMSPLLVLTIDVHTYCKTICLYELFRKDYKSLSKDLSNEQASRSESGRSTTWAIGTGRNDFGMSPLLVLTNDVHILWTICLFNLFRKDYKSLSKDFSNEQTSRSESGRSTTWAIGTVRNHFKRLWYVASFGSNEWRTHILWTICLYDLFRKDYKSLSKDFSNEQISRS